MSRIGKQPIPIPAGVEVRLEGNTVRVKGPKGELTRTLHEAVQVAVDDGKIVVSRASDEPQHRALHGLTRTLVANMVKGVTEGFEKNLEISGVGYRASKQGRKLVLAMGYSHPVEMEPPPGIEIEVPAANRISVRGIDKELVGEIAARIRRVRPVEPYLGKGIRYVGEQVRRKAGKAGKVSRG
ncbi:MAG: 50S ribosomal protein L6 [Limnochordales bacterium]|nr:50S ribosomal protein L6 [Limnochordales bacterium]